MVCDCAAFLFEIDSFLKNLFNKLTDRDYGRCEYRSVSELFADLFNIFPIASSSLTTFSLNEIYIFFFISTRNGQVFFVRFSLLLVVEGDWHLNEPLPLWFLLSNIVEHYLNLRFQRFHSIFSLFLNKIKKNIFSFFSFNLLLKTLTN